MSPTTRTRAIDGGWFAFWLLLGTTWCVGSAFRIGATFDEPVYLWQGLDAWHTGHSRLLLEWGTMPLPVHVATLPLYLWEQVRGRPFDVDADLGKILPVARLAMLPFWWLLLTYGWIAGRQVGGPWGGRLAVAFLACEPNLLGHATLAATDVALTACLLPLFVHYRAGRDGPWLRRVGLPALLLAAATLAKVSGLVFGVLGIAILEAERAVRQAGGARPIRAALFALFARRFWYESLQTGCLALALVFVYCGSGWRVSPSFVEWAHRLPQGATGSAMVWLSEHLCVFSNAGNAIARQVRHNMTGHGAYLLGEVAPRAIWYYFPVALSIKLTLATLLLLPLLAVASPRSLLNWVCLIAAALLLFSLNCRVQIGVRLVLPLVAVGVIGLAAAAGRAVQDLAPGWRRRLLIGGVAASLGWATWSAAAVWPNGLCYANELWGGTANGYLCLSDSNYDWGQGVKELARWRRGHSDAPLEVWYFGNDKAALHRLSADSLSVDGLPGTAPDDFRAYFRGRVVAASTTMLYGSYTTVGANAACAAYLRSCEPAGRTTTFLIYDFRTPAAKAK